MSLDIIDAIFDEINTLKTTLNNIKNAIINKGQTPSGGITTYATAISNIQSGSGSSLPNGLHKITVNVTPSDAAFGYKYKSYERIFNPYNSNEIIGYPGAGCCLYVGKYGYVTQQVSSDAASAFIVVGDSDTTRNITLQATNKTYWTPTSNKYYLNITLTESSEPKTFRSADFYNAFVFEINNDKISKGHYKINDSDMICYPETISKYAPYNIEILEPDYVIAPQQQTYLYTENNHILVFAPKDYNTGYSTVDMGGDSNPLQLYEYDFPNQILTPILLNNEPVYLYTQASSYEFEEADHIIYEPETGHLIYDSMYGSISLGGGGNLYDGQEISLYQDNIGDTVYLGEDNTLPLFVYIYGNDEEVTEVTHYEEYDENGNYVGSGEGDYDSSGNYTQPYEYTNTVTKYYGVFRVYDNDTNEWIDVYSPDGKRYCVDCNGDSYVPEVGVYYFEDDYTQPTGHVQFEGSDFYLSNY